MTPENLLENEKEIARLWNEGELPFLTHLSGGNEEWLFNFFQKNIKATDWVLASHRCHYHYQLHEATDLIEKVKAGKSMFLYGPRFICSAIVAGCAGIAAGLALSIHRRNGSERVWCFQGDGAEDQGHFYEAVRLVHSRELPCTFIIEDNDGSCGVTKDQRRAVKWDWPSCVIRHEYKMTWPHAGTGIRPNLKK